MSLDNLPVEWCLTDWVNITNTQDGFKRGPFGGSLKKETFVATGYAVYEQYAPINDDCTRFRYFIDENKYQELEKFSVEENDFLISCSGTMGRITQVPAEAPKGVINQALLRIRLIKNAIDSGYFLYLFKSPEFQNEILSGAVGGAIVNLASVRDLKAIKIPLPSLAEQKEIVRQLEVMLAQVEQIKARLDAIPAILKKFRQSVLADAVSGKLTEEWRGTSDLSNWQNKTLGDISVVKTGKTPSRKESRYWKDASIPWLTSSATGNNFTNHADEFISEIASKECNLRPFPKGTLLLAMYGEGKTRGQVTELLIDATCNQACAAILVNNEIAHKSFVKIRLLENYENIRKAASGGNQPNLNLNKVREIDIALPPLAEQSEIVQIVKKLFV
ncbi:restriction endonuclease subunit S [Acinetobacter soli]|uniref:restriction endonuclease subunit S n=1 Tax=Acinetobacter soli TaxID=487316 RepID=UPI001C08DFF2|nr:restriction endonuclease subunit S [Acinetobacter soli]